MKRRFALLTAAFLFTAALAAQSSAAPDPWAGLRFLIGSWQAQTTGGTAHAHSIGSYAFELELRDHVLARHSAGSGCKGPRDFDCEHTDLLYIYPGASAESWQAIYFDNEGHVIRYTISTPRPGSAIFLSDPGQAGPQFRLTYELSGQSLNGRFQLKMPGQPDFVSYLEWTGKRQ